MTALLNKETQEYVHDNLYIWNSRIYLLSIEIVLPYLNGSLSYRLMIWKEMNIHNVHFIATTIIDTYWGMLRHTLLSIYYIHE